MLGRLSWDAIPFNQPLPLYSMAVVGIVILAVLGIITKRTDNERLRYAAYCFACFLAAIFGLSWLMYLGHG